MSYEKLLDIIGSILGMATESDFQPEYRTNLIDALVALAIAKIHMEDGGEIDPKEMRRRIVRQWNENLKEFVRQRNEKLRVFAAERMCEEEETDDEDDDEPFAASTPAPAANGSSGALQSGGSVAGAGSKAADANIKK